MNIAKYTTVGLLLMGMVTFNSCTKEVVGPKGEQGVQGNQGEKGEKGDKGEKGNDGNANVVGTNSIAINSSNWTYNSTAKTYTVGIAVNGITQDVVNKGLVQVFRVYSDGNVPLPEIMQGHATSFLYTTGSVKLSWNKVDGTTPVAPINGVYRIVIISPSNLAENPNVNWKNYEEVKNALNLE